MIRSNWAVPRAQHPNTTRLLNHQEKSIMSSTFVSLLLYVSVSCLVWTSVKANLRVGAWNVQTFGPSKLSKVESMILIVDIIRRYDVVLIQEIRDSRGNVIPTTIERLNEIDGEGAWAAEYSERLGRSSYKEQYAYFYRTDKLNVLITFQFDDGEDNYDDWFEREPYAILFDAPTTRVGKFGLIGLHAKPGAEETARELGFLDEVYDEVSVVFGTRDTFMLGDFNAACSYITEDDWSIVDIRSGLFDWLIPDDADTTVKTTSCAYDRIVAGGNLRNHIVSGSAQVYDFTAEYLLTQDQAEQVSDHFPVEVTLR